MALGRQFENTYWEDPGTGEVNAWTRNENAPKPTHTVGEEPPSGSQGLLFHPLTGTGMRGDSMIPESTRESTIRKLFGFTSPEKYKENLGRIVPSQKVTHIDYRQDDQGNPVIESVPRLRGQDQYYRHPEGKSWNQVQDPKNPHRVLRQAFIKRISAKISDKQAQNHMDWITEATSDTDIPIQILNRRADNPMKVVLDPTPGRAYIEGGGNNIRLTYPRGRTSRTEYVDVETREPSEIPIHNPKFWEHLDAARRKAPDGNDHEEISADDAFRLATHWVHPETGHTLSSDEAINFRKEEAEKWNKESRGSNSNDTTANYLRSLGYVPNLFPGKPSLTSSAYAAGATGKVETGYGNWDRGKEYTHATFHTRFKPDDTKPPRVVKQKVTTRETPKISKSTIIHETGHALDPNLSDRNSNQMRLNTTADPIKEGIADAVADRYVRYKGVYTDALADTGRRLQDFRGSGYTVDYSGWQNNLHRALYVGTRFHTALSDTNFETLPGRESFAKDFRDHISKIDRESGNTDRAKSNFLNTMALGHMYDKFTHIHGILREAGLEKVAKEAHAEYRKHMGLVPKEQPTLPGMEKFA